MNGENLKSQNYNGWLIIDKPLGITSAHVVSKVKRIIGRNNKLGHAGTLDPLASGVLPLAIGEATKLVQFLIDTDKEYEFEVTWGEERSTDDAEGEVVARVESRESSFKDFDMVLKNFVGEIDQVPPKYSAIKVQGQRAYDLARSDKPVELKPRKVTIHSLKPLDSRLSTLTTSFKMHCSKGTYVRSIARDLGRELGCFGYVSRLRRTAHGQFRTEHSISLEKLEELWQNGVVSSGILPVEEVLDGIPAFPLDENSEAKIRHGIAIENIANLKSENIALMKDKKLVAIATPVGTKLQPKRVFNH